MLSSETCKIFKNAYFEEHMRTTSGWRTIFCHNVSRMDFFIWRKNVPLSKYLDFYIIDKCTNFKMFNFVMEVTVYYLLHFKLFL